MASINTLKKEIKILEFVIDVRDACTARSYVKHGYTLKLLKKKISHEEWIADLNSFGMTEINAVRLIKYADRFQSTFCKLPHIDEATFSKLSNVSEKDIKKFEDTGFLFGLTLIDLTLIASKNMVSQAKRITNIEANKVFRNHACADVIAFG